MLTLAVDGPDEEQGDGELEEQAVHQDQVADGGDARLDVHGGEHLCVLCVFVWYFGDGFVNQKQIIDGGLVRPSSTYVPPAASSKTPQPPHPTHHDGRQPRGEDGVLAGVQQREGRLCLQGRALVLLEGGIVAVRLVRLVVEVLDLLVGFGGLGGLVVD